MLETAWLQSGDQTFVARHERVPHEPHSAVTRLIQGIWERDPAKARMILRARIFTTATLTPMCRGMVAIAAKRVTEACDPAGAPALFEEVSGGNIASASDEETITVIPENAALVMRATELATRSRGTSPARFELNRGVAACLVEPEGRTLSWAVNENARIKTEHAEVRLLQAYWARHGRPLPLGTRILTTLQPCKMCAGMIHEAAQDPASLEVIYVDPDPGPAARMTALERIARQW